MKEAIWTSSGGIRRRCRPSRSARSSVVAASSTEAATPSVPLARMFQAPHSPDSLRLIPRTATRGPSATNGISRAKATNGTSISSRLSRNPAGIRAAPAAAAISSA